VTAQRSTLTCTQETTSSSLTVTTSMKQSANNCPICYCTPSEWRPISSHCRSADHTV